MDELTNHNNNFSNFVKNQKLKESLEHTQFNEFIDILRRIEDIKDEIKSLKNLNQNEILNLQTPNNENQITKCDHKNLSPKTFENEKNKNFSSLNTQNIPKYSFDFSEPETLVKISPNELKEKIINSPTQKAQEIEKKNAPEIILEENEIILMAIDECLKQETQQILNEEENLQNKNLIVKKERLLGELTKNLRDKSYNVKGIVLNVTASINKSDKYSTYKITNKIKFDIEIKLKDTMYQNEYNIYLFNAKCELTSRLESLNKNSEIYLLNLKIAIKEGQFYLFQTTETKIFLRILNILDYYNPLFLNEENKKLALENINKPKLLKDSDKFGRKFIPNKNTYSKNLFSNLVDITKNNEFEFLDLIDTGCINEYLTKIPNELKDIANLLVKEVDHTVYCTSNSQSINKGMKKKDACGMILTHKKEEKLTSIELISLKDSNVIKIIHYNKNFTLELKENMIIIINNISLKINKNFDCILENPLEKNINIVGILSKEESAKLKKFRFDKNKDYDCIISLVSNKIIRNIQKFNVTIKKIYKIIGTFEKGHNKINGYPDLKLYMKCLVDDGTYEGLLNVHDQNVINLMSLGENYLKNIFNLSKNCGNLIIYEKINRNKILGKECFEEIFVRQFDLYCVPYSNVARKQFFDNSYNKCFENLFNDNKFQNKLMNILFVNGDVVIDKSFNDKIIIPRPFLNAIHLEFLDFD